MNGVTYMTTEKIVDENNRIDNQVIEFETYEKKINGKPTKFIRIIRTDSNGRKTEIITKVETLKHVVEINGQ